MDSARPCLEYFFVSAAKLIVNKPLLILLLFVHTSIAVAQVKKQASEDWQLIFFERPATAIPLLTNAAVEHSARLKALSIEKSISQEDIKLAKKNILGAVSINGNYGYGNLAGGGVTDPGNSSLFRTSPSIRYFAGIGVGLPLDRAVSRGALLKKQELNYQRAEMEQQEQQNQLRQQIIQLYQNVLLTKKLLALQQQAYVTVHTNYQLMEKQFRQGQLSLPELSAASSQLTQAAIAQESARSQFDTAFMLLEEIAGAKISSLMTNQ